jgi:hypothetical protein
MLETEVSECSAIQNNVLIVEQISTSSSSVRPWISRIDGPLVHSARTPQCTLRTRSRSTPSPRAETRCVSCTTSGQRRLLHVRSFSRKRSARYLVPWSRRRRLAWKVPGRCLGERSVIGTYGRGMGGSTPIERWVRMEDEGSTADRSRRKWSYMLTRTGRRRIWHQSKMAARAWSSACNRCREGCVDTLSSPQRMTSRSELSSPRAK